MRTRSVVGVLVGGLTDIVATNILVLPLLVYVAMTHDFTGVPPGNVGVRMLEIMRDSSGTQVTGWLLGLGATALGGYVAARIARTAEVKHGAWSGWLCMGLGIYSLFAASSTVPMWQHALAFVLSPTFGAFGGYLRLRQVSREKGGDSGVGTSLAPA